MSKNPEDYGLPKTLFGYPVIISDSLPSLTGDDLVIGKPILASEVQVSDDEACRALEEASKQIRAMTNSVVDLSDPKFFPRSDRNVVVTVLDTETGRTATDERFSAFWWAEGNGSCDCNRRYLFDSFEDEGVGVCKGAHRYLIVSCSDPDGYTYEDFNDDYPKELVDRHRPASFTGPLP